MSDEQTSKVRTDSLYISWQVRKSLNYAALKNIEPERVTGDAIAERVLSEWLAVNHPDIVAHFQNQHDVDQEFRNTLKPKPPFA